MTDRAAGSAEPHTVLTSTTPVPTDAVLALAYLRAIVRGHDVDREATWFVVPGPPAAKERPRQGRGHFYTPSATKAAEGALAFYWRAAAGDRVPSGNIAVAAVFYVADERVKDCDNMLKLVLDAGNRAEVWVDDSFVTVHAAGLELDRDRPRTVVAFCPTESTLVRAARRCSRCAAPLTRLAKGLCRSCGTLNRRGRR
jgi:Holliday junction resolvase RusA-like endonuclease